MWDVLLLWSLLCFIHITARQKYCQFFSIGSLHITLVSRCRTDFKRSIKHVSVLHGSTLIERMQSLKTHMCLHQHTMNHYHFSPQEIIRRWEKTPALVLHGNKNGIGSLSDFHSFMRLILSQKSQSPQHILNTIVSARTGKH